MAVSFQDPRSQGIKPVHDFEDLIGGATTFPKSMKRRKARIRSPQDGMAIAGDHATFFQPVPNKFAQLSVRRGAAEFILDLEHKVQTFLVGEPVERPGAAIHSRRNSQE